MFTLSFSNILNFEKMEKNERKKRKNKSKSQPARSVLASQPASLSATQPARQKPASQQTTQPGPSVRVSRAETRLTVYRSAYISSKSITAGVVLGRPPGSANIYDFCDFEHQYLFVCQSVTRYIERRSIIL